MAETLGALLERQAGAITGRAAERAQLRRLLEPDGPAGMGRTTLLHAFAADARAAGWVTVGLDAHTMHCTHGTVLAALAGTGGAEAPALEAAAAALGARGERVVLLVDTYELLRML